MITRLLIVLGALLVLGAVDLGAFHEEAIRRGGETLYLELAPVDPRSLMQGDYMALRFRLAQQLARTPAGARVGYAPLALDEHRVATLAAAPASAALRLRYRLRAGEVWLGTNAFFFEEGDGARWRTARYGEFRIDRASGEAVLVGLRDEQLRPL